jgi:CDP-diacylglycerol--glycerol-3-phosphate 3-phosphatidyltransferase
MTIILEFSIVRLTGGYCPEQVVFLRRDTVQTGEPVTLTQEQTFFNFPGVRRRVFWIGIWHFTGLLLAAFVLAQMWTERFVIQWCLQAIAVLTYIHIRLWINLNRFPLAPVTPSDTIPLGIANHITLVRGWLISLLAGFLFLDSPAIYGLLPALIYALATGTDQLDGLWARFTQTQSRLGQQMDMEMDALGILIASSLAVWMERIPSFYLLVGLSYYLFQWGIWYRTTLNKSLSSLVFRPLARILAGGHMVFLILVLSDVFTDQIVFLTAIVLAVPLLVGFVWDWCIVSDRLSPEKRQQMVSAAETFAFYGMPVMRAILLVCGLTAIRLYGDLWSISAVLLWLMAITCTTVGWMGRTAAFIVSFQAAMTAPQADYPVTLAIILCIALTVMIFGTGFGSLWQPEDRFLVRPSDRLRG